MSKAIVRDFEKSIKEATTIKRLEQLDKLNDVLLQSVDKNNKRLLTVKEFIKIDDLIADRLIEIESIEKSNLSKDETYTVWVGGVEVVDYYVSKQVANQIKNEWLNKGYTDCQIELITASTLVVKKSQ
tara:strand:+ start:68 stop:451 length:384 start_codon:yes stop_codon:yes gene_type:complete